MSTILLGSGALVACPGMDETRQLGLLHDFYETTLSALQVRKRAARAHGLMTPCSTPLGGGIQHECWTVTIRCPTVDSHRHRPSRNAG